MRLKSSHMELSWLAPLLQDKYAISSVRTTRIIANNVPASQNCPRLAVREQLFLYNRKAAERICM